MHLRSVLCVSAALAACDSGAGRGAEQATPSAATPGTPAAQNEPCVRYTDCESQACVAGLCAAASPARPGSGGPADDVGDGGAVDSGEGEGEGGAGPEVPPTPEGLLRLYAGRLAETQLRAPVRGLSVLYATADGRLMRSDPSTLDTNDLGATGGFRLQVGDIPHANRQPAPGTAIGTYYVLDAGVYAADGDAEGGHLVMPGLQGRPDVRYSDDGRAWLLTAHGRAVAYELGADSPLDLGPTLYGAFAWEPQTAQFMAHVTAATGEPRVVVGRPAEMTTLTLPLELTDRISAHGYPIGFAAGGRIAVVVDSRARRAGVVDVDGDEPGAVAEFSLGDCIHPGCESAGWAAADGSEWVAIWPLGNPDEGATQTDLGFFHPPTETMVRVADWNFDSRRDGFMFVPWLEAVLYERRDRTPEGDSQIAFLDLRLGVGAEARTISGPELTLDSACAFAEPGTVLVRGGRGADSYFVTIDREGDDTRIDTSLISIGCQSSAVSPDGRWARAQIRHADGSVTAAVVDVATWQAVELPSTSAAAWLPAGHELVLLRDFNAGTGVGTLVFLDPSTGQQEVIATDVRSFHPENGWFHGTTVLTWAAQTSVGWLDLADRVVRSIEANPCEDTVLRPRTGNSWVAVETRCGEAEGHVLLAIDLATGRRREVDDPRQATATPVSDTHMLLRTPTDAWLLRLDGEDPPRHLATGVAAAAASGDGRWVYLYIETESDPDAPADGVYAIAVE